MKNSFQKVNETFVKNLDPSRLTEITCRFLRFHKHLFSIHDYVDLDYVCRSTNNVYRGTPLDHEHALRSNSVSFEVFIKLICKYPNLYQILYSHINAPKPTHTLTLTQYLKNHGGGGKGGILH